MLSTEALECRRLLTATLTHFYPFDSDAADSVGANDGQLLGGAHIVTDLVRQNVLELDGIDDYVLLNSSNVPNGGGAASDVFSISFWSKLNGVGGATSANTGIYGEYDSNGVSQKNTLLLTKATGQLSFSQFPPSGGDLNSPNPLTDNSWHHIAYVQNDSVRHSRKLYVDGILAASDNSPENFIGSAPDVVTIGARFGTSGTLGEFAAFTHGRIDDLGFYDGALSAQEVASLASVGFPNGVLATAGYEAELFANVDSPFSLAIAPSGSDFELLNGTTVYVTSVIFDGDIDGPADRILRIDKTKAISEFANLIGEADPVSLEFPPVNSSFAPALYVSANNRDGGEPGDRGGTIQQVNASGDWVDFTAVQTPAGGTALSEPAGIAFSTPGSVFGESLFVANLHDDPFDMATVSVDGSVSPLFEEGATARWVTISRGGQYGETIFYSDGDTIRTRDPFGNTSLHASADADVQAIALAPTGVFDGMLYVSEADGTVSEIDANGTMTEILAGFTDPRGIAFSDDGSTMFVADYAENAVYRVTRPTSHFCDETSQDTALSINSGSWSAGGGSGSVGDTGVTISSSPPEILRTTFTDNRSDIYQNANLFGNLALAPTAIGDGDMATVRMDRSGSLGGNVSFTLQNTTTNPTFFIEDIDFQNASIVVPAGFRDAFVSPGGSLSANLLTVVGANDSPVVSAAFRYEGTFPAGTAFDFDFDWTSITNDVSAEHIAIAMSAQSTPIVNRTVINDNFNTEKSSDILTFKGDARYAGNSSNGYITLVPGSSDKLGTVILDSHQERALDFDLVMNYSIKQGNEADGIGVGYGALSGAAFGEKGQSQTRNGLWVVMDTFRGSAGNAELEVWYNKEKLYDLSLPSSAMRGNFAKLTLKMRHSGTTGILTLQHSSSLIGTRTITIPDWNPQSNWRYGMGARTGARYDWHVVENLTIKDVTGSRRPDAQVAVNGAGFLRDDSEGVSWDWSTSDLNGDLRQVDLILRNRFGQIVRTESQTSGFRRDAGSASGTFDWIPSDGVGEFTLELVAYDGYGCADDVASPLTVVDDDTVGPEIVLTYGADMIAFDEPIAQSHGIENSISWTASDSQTGDSGINRTVTEVYRDGQLVYRLPGGANGTISLDAYGTGVFDVFFTSFDNDAERGSVDQATTTVSGQMTITNTAPQVEAGLDRNAKEGEPGTFSVQGFVDADGETPLYNWDFGNGNVLDGDEVSFAFHDQGAYPVTVTATDAFGGTTTDTLTVHVSNADPKINSVAVTENAQPGQPVDFTVLAGDVADDTLTYEFDFTSDGTVDSAGDSRTASYVYTQPGLYTTTIRVRDEDGGETAEFVTVPVGVVNATLPVVQFTTSESVLSEGSPATTVIARLSESAAVPVQIPISVSGTAEPADYELSTRLLSFPAGTTEATFQVQAVDDVVDEADSQTLTLSATTGSGLPTTHTVSINDNDPSPKVRMAPATQEVNEDAGPVLITAELDQISERDVTVPIQFDGTALQGADWEQGLTGAEIVIPAGQLAGSFVIEVLPDAIPEGNETVVVQLGSPANAILDNSAAAATAHTLVILYNDAPRVQWTSINKRVSEAAGTIELTAKLSTASTLPIAVDWSLIDGSATVHDDFTLPTSGILHFAPGDVEQVLSIPIVDDSTSEGSENVVLELGNPTNAQLGQPTRTVATIIDNDRKVSLTTTSQTVWEDAGFAVVTAQISEPSAEPVEIPIVVRGATATEGEDYAVDQHVIVIPANELTGSVLIPIVNDLENEPFVEELVVRLRDPANASVRSTWTQTITINDDDPIVLAAEHKIWVSEDIGTVSLGVTLSAPSNKTVRIPVSLSGYLSSGSDFTFLSGPEIVIPPGAVESGLGINVVDDSFGEGNESVTFKLESAQNAVVPKGYVIVTQWGWLGSQWYPFQAVQNIDDITLTVEDNDGDTFIRFTDEKIRTTEKDQDFTKTVRVTLNRPAPEDIFVPIELTKEGFLRTNSAKEFKDYRKPAGIVIPKGEKSASGSIRIIADNKREATETVNFEIGIVQATFGEVRSKQPFHLELTIDDDDAPATTTSKETTSQSNSTPTRSDQLEIDTKASQNPPPLKIPTNNASGPVNSGSLEIGNASDGYISGGTVFFDGNRNGVIDFLDLNSDGNQDSDEPSEPSTTTFVDGTFAMEIPPAFDTNGDGSLTYDEGRYVIIGGIDASTGVPLQVALTGPAEVPAVSPLTTVLDHLLVGSTDPAAELSRLQEAFELTQSDFLFTNTIWDAYQSKAHPQQVHRINAQLHNTAVVISEAIAAIDGSPPIAWIGERTYAAMADAISTPGATLNLQQPFVIDSLMRTVLDAAGLSADSQQITGVANALAIVNSQIADTDATSGLEFLTQVAKAQSLAQDDLANDFANVFAGDLPLSEVVANYSETQVLAKIAAKPARDVLPPAVAISDVRHIEGDSGETFAELTVRLFQPSVDPVSVRYRTLESTADAGIDYTTVDDVLEWAPGDTTTRTIQIPIHGDSDFEGDERVLVELYDPSNSVIRRDLGTVYISDQDNFSYQVPPGLAEAELELSYDDSRILLIQNDEILFDVLADSSRPITITGASDRPTNLVVTLGDDRAAIAGGLVFVGQTDSDLLHINNALEQTFAHDIESQTDGRLSFPDGYIQYFGVSLYSDDVSPAINLPQGLMLEGSQQTLTAIPTVNTDEFATSYSWVVTNSDGHVVAESNEGVTLDWTPTDNGSYRVELMTTSAFRGMYTTAMSLVVANADPTFDPDSINPTFQVVENSAEGTMIGSLSASDPAGLNDPLSFAITGGSGSAAFEIDPSTGDITVKDASQLDFETTTSFTLDVTVSDGDAGSSTTTVAIELLNQASIFGNVFLDANTDGVFNANEDGLDNVLIELLDNNGVLLESTITSDGGFYLFEDYEPGEYQIREVQPTGVEDGPELLGSLGGTTPANDLMAVTLQRDDATDYLFSEFGSAAGSRDAASIGFWQNKRGQKLIKAGGTALADWLTTNFTNTYGDSLDGASGADVATFYRTQLFRQKSRKGAGPAKVDAQFMAIALSVYFTNRTLGGDIGASYGFKVTDTGLGSKLVNVGRAGKAFDSDNDSDLSVWSLLQATNRLTNINGQLGGFASIYDTNGDGVIDADEKRLRIHARRIYASIGHLSRPDHYSSCHASPRS